MKCTLSQQQRDGHQRRDNRHGDLPKKGLSKYTYYQCVVAFAKTSAFTLWENVNLFIFEVLKTLKGLCRFYHSAVPVC